jgi:hypothetical protein
MLEKAVECSTFPNGCPLQPHPVASHPIAPAHNNAPAHSFEPPSKSTYSPARAGTADCNVAGDRIRWSIGRFDGLMGSQAKLREPNIVGDWPQWRFS